MSKNLVVYHRFNLQNYISRMNQDTIYAARLNAAYAIAELTLHDKLDKHGAPLFDHACRVACRCIAAGLSEDQIIAAVLHDCVEDGNLQPSTIRNLFGRNVERMVVYLTRPDPPISYIVYLSDIVDECPEAIPIKLADLEDNLDENRGPIEPSLRSRYIDARNRLSRHLPTNVAT